MSGPVNVVLTLRAAGVGLVLDLVGGRLPAVLHWGADLGEITVDDARAMLQAAGTLVGPNEVDDPIRLALLPEHWTGWSGRPGLSGSREGRDWSPRFITTALRVDGEPVTSSDDLQVVALGAAAVEVDAVDDVAHLGLTVRLELFASGLVRAQAEVTNLADDVYRVDDLVLALPVPSVADEILDFGGRWGKERFPQRRAMTVGTHLREGRKGRTGADAATLLHLGTPGFTFGDGEIWAVHTGWSGNHTHYAERLFTGVQVIGGGELLLPGEVRLARAESYASPWLYASHAVGLDAVAARFHRYLRARPGHPGTDRPVTINVWEAVYFRHDLDQLVDLAERAAALGVERYVLDDGWFGARRDDHAGLGDWTVSSEVWPDGLHPLVDRVRALGMEFGLWFEPEMINEDSDVAREHPEWIMATGQRLPVESRFQQVINLGIPECYAYVRDAILAVLDEYDIGYIKWDHNRDLVDAGTQPAGRPGVHAQTEAFYRMLDELQAAHPGLEIESCSSGGARVDLGVLQHTQRVWVSDCIDPHERQQMNRWTSQLIPLELMGSHIASGRSHTTGRIHDLGFRAATAIFGHLGIEWDLSKASEQELTELGEWVAFYKEHRDVLLSGDLVRLDFPDSAISAQGVVATDRSRAVYAYALLERTETSSAGRLRMPGLDPARRYRVRPALVGGVPRLFKAPTWWNLELTTPTYDNHDPASVVPGTDTDSGVTLSGAVLGTVGLMNVALNPDQAVVYVAEAVD